MTRAAAPAVDLAAASRRRDRDDVDRTITWPVVLVAAAVTALLPITALFAVGARPAGTEGWLVLAGPVLVAAAVGLSPVAVEWAAGVLAVTMAFLIAPASAMLDGADSWASVAGIALYLGVCWVSCAVGRQLPPGRSVAWMAGVLLAILWGTGLDVPMVLGAGWWLVGRTLRHQEQVTVRLRSRARELAAEQQRFAAEAVRLERARIARELHDVIAHCMTVIVIQARAGQQQADTDPAAVTSTFDAIVESATEATADLDALVTVLEPHRPARGPLRRESLEALVRRAAETGTTVSLDVRGDPEVLDPARAAVGLRALQEAVTNALRHAPGSEVTVCLDCRRGLALTVRNGPPVAAGPATVGTGGGLAGMRDRAAGLGGSTSWGPTADGGWLLQVTLD